MRHKQLMAQPKTYVLIFDTGDEIIEGLSRFAAEQNLAGSSFTAIGALSRARLAWFDWESKKYPTAVDLDEQVELLSLIGDVASRMGSRLFMRMWSWDGGMAVPMAVIWWKHGCGQHANSS